MPSRTRVFLALHMKAHPAWAGRPDGPATLAGSGGHDADRDPDRLHRRKRRTVGVVHRRVGLERLSGLRNRLISLAPQASVSAEPTATGKNDQLTEGYSEPSAAGPCRGAKLNACLTCNDLKFAVSSHSLCRSAYVVWLGQDRISMYS